MHYGPYFFAEDEGKPTISAKNGEEVGGSDDFTEVFYIFLHNFQKNWIKFAELFKQSDIEDINLLYQCQDNDLDE